MLGDLCRDAEAGWYSPDTRQWLENVSGETLAGSGLLEDLEASHPLAQQVVMLRYSRRFGEGSGIGQLARWVNQQNPEQARQLLDAGSHDLFACTSRASMTAPWSAWCWTGRAAMPRAIATT